MVGVQRHGAGAVFCEMSDGTQARILSVDDSGALHEVLRAAVAGAAGGPPLAVTPARLSEALEVFHSVRQYQITVSWNPATAMAHHARQAAFRDIHHAWPG